MATVVIIGASRGIGLALTENYASQNHEVVGVCRRPTPELMALNIRVITDINVTDDNSIRLLAHQLGSKQIDLLIHNAGILMREDWTHMNFDDIRTQFEVNTLGPLKTVYALKENLSAGGKIALMTSRMGSIQDNTSGGYYGYRVSKCGLNMVAKCLALDLASEDFAVGVFHPGFVKTDMTNGHGDVSPQNAAAMLVAQFEKLNMKTTGQFFHANGAALPW